MMEAAAQLEETIDRSGVPNAIVSGERNEKITDLPPASFRLPPARCRQQVDAHSSGIGQYGHYFAPKANQSIDQCFRRKTGLPIGAGKLGRFHDSITLRDCRKKPLTAPTPTIWPVLVPA